MDVLNLLNEVLKLVPVVVVAAPLIAILIDVAKKVKLLPDGYAGVANLLLNAGFWLLLYGARQVGVEAEANEVIRQMSVFAPAVIGLIMVLLGSKWFHQNVARTVGIAFSHPN